MAANSKAQARKALSKLKKAAPKKKATPKKQKSGTANRASKLKTANSKKASPKNTKASKATKQQGSKVKATQTENRAGKLKTDNGMLPTRDGVLVERVQEHDRTPGGLYIPVSAMEKPLKGLVVRAGRGKISKRGKLRPLDVQPGDQVLFGKYAGTEIKIDGKEFLLIREDEILGVVS